MEGILLDLPNAELSFSVVIQGFLVLQSKVTLHTCIKYPNTYDLIMQPCHITLDGLVLEIVRKYNITQLLMPLGKKLEAFSARKRS